MPTVLVTGAARGIGRATAEKLVADGWTVLGGVRRAEDGEALRAAGIEPVTLGRDGPLHADARARPTGSNVQIWVL